MWHSKNNQKTKGRSRFWILVFVFSILLIIDGDLFLSDSASLVFCIGILLCCFALMGLFSLISKWIGSKKTKSESKVSKKDTTKKRIETPNIAKSSVLEAASRDSIIKRQEKNYMIIN